MSSSSLLRKLMELLRGPQGRRIVSQVQQASARPGVRRQLAALLQRLGGGRRH